MRRYAGIVCAFSLCSDQYRLAAIPIENFHPVLAPAGKYKQVSREDIQLQVLADQRLQTVKALAHIARREAEVHPHAGRQVDHPRSTFSTIRNVVMSTPGLMRSRSPVASTSSIIGSAVRSCRRALLSTRANRTGPVPWSRFRQA